MEQRNISCSSSLVFSYLLLLLLLCLFSSGSVEAYKNYTVGDSLGWFDNLLKPTVNYQKWAADKNFTLGDFLIFNTDSNHSIVQTYNFTTYKRCDYDNAQENDTTEWSAADPSSTTPQPVSMPIPLVKQGMNYFFSGDYDGEQCKFGQHFKINVTYGQGLPPSLKTSSDDSPAPANPDSGDDESAPDTVVPSNFNNPHDSSDDKVDSGAVSLSLKLFGRGSNGVLLLLGANLLFLIS
ncbi:early nodulin-like protein 18 [Actinidia eriantha]|uniref:early nodulin-like protein 18 n=1 Tax=Actinidia eriantha TaxID=165200 RepID=UPI00258A826B|nr:early nodulin-like protein 18 [Actinidia eriantha]